MRVLAQPKRDEIKADLKMAMEITSTLSPRGDYPYSYGPICAAVFTEISRLRGSSANYDSYFKESGELSVEYIFYPGTLPIEAYTHDHEWGEWFKRNEHERACACECGALKVEQIS